MKALFLIVAAAVFALFAGLGLAVVGGLGLLVLVPVVAAVLIVYDYRIGVVVLALIIPLSGSMFVPRAEGLNPYTYVTAAAVAGLMLRKFSGPSRLVWPPRILLYCFVLPLGVGFFLGLPHLGEGARNLLKIDPGAVLDTIAYLKQFIHKPLVLLLFACLLANAIVDSKQPGRFVVLFAVSASMVVIYVMLFTWFSGVSWGAHRLVINKAGMHYNAYGQLFALAFGPLLYVAFSERGPWRLFFGCAAMIVFVGLVLNFARAGMLAALITLAILLWQRRSLGVAVSLVCLVAIVFLGAPDEWRSRMLQGSDEVATSYSGERYEALTSGRVQGWLDLAPDVALSPLYGRGMLSTLWSTAVTQGLYASNHPHNMYLQLLLDVGLLGAMLVLYFFYRMLRRMRELSRDEGMEPRLRAFFAGSFASYAGVLALAVTGWDWYPTHEQGFLWFSLGFVFAYWNRSASRATQDRAGTTAAVKPPLPVGPWRPMSPTHVRR